MERLSSGVQLVLVFFLGLFLLFLVRVSPPSTGFQFVLRVWGVYIITLIWAVHIALSRPAPRYALMAGGFLYVSGFIHPWLALAAVIPALVVIFWYFLVRPYWWAYIEAGWRGVLKALGGLVGANLTAFAVAWPGNILPRFYLEAYGDTPERTAANYVRYVILFAGYYVTYRYLVRGRERRQLQGVVEERRHKDQDNAEGWRPPPSAIRHRALRRGVWRGVCSHD